VAVAALTAFVVPALGFAQSLVGVKNCRRCHESEYARWLMGPHARAHESLSQDQLSDNKCAVCHLTSASAAAGTAKSGPKVSLSVAKGVECESCHGGGKYYYHSFVMRDRELSRALGLVIPNQSHCERCHTAASPGLQSFSFDAAWKKISHGGTRDGKHGPAATADFEK